MEAKSPKTYDLTPKRLRADQSLLKTQLRQFFMMSKLAAYTRAKARTARGSYRCNHCKQVFPRNCIEIDHIVGFEPAKNFKTLHAYFTHLSQGFFLESNLQVLCTFCHKQKTGGWYNETGKLAKDENSA